jgi:hypothetical protein
LWFSGAYYAYCTKAGTHAAVEDELLRRKVWSFACDELGIEDDWLRDIARNRAAPQP